MSVFLLPTFALYLFVMASLSTSSIRSSCHNREVIVGDGHVSWKTEGGYLQGVVTLQQPNLIHIETESSADQSL